MKEVDSSKLGKRQVLVRLAPITYDALLIRAAEETVHRRKAVNVQTLIVEAIDRLLNDEKTE